MRMAFEASAFAEVGGGVEGPDGTIGAEVDLAVATPEFDLLAALSREQIEQMLLTSDWDQELSIE